MPTSWKLNACTIFPDENLVKLGDQSITLAPKAMDLLVVFCESPGQTLSRDALLESVWPGRYGADVALSRTISELRKSLSSLGLDNVIKTVPKRGYKLTANAERVDATTQPNVETKKLSSPAKPRASKLWFGLIACLLVISAFSLVLFGHHDTTSVADLSDADQSTYAAALEKLDGMRPEALQSAALHFQHLVDTYPDFAPAKVNLALTITHQLNWGQLDEEVGFQRALGLLNEVRAQNVDSALLNFAYGFLYSPKAITHNYSDIQKATAHYERALELEPDDTRTLRYYAQYTMAGGDLQRAIKLVNKALRLDRTRADTHATLAYLQFFQGEHEAALTQAQQTIELFPFKADGYAAAMYILLFQPTPSIADYNTAADLARQCLDVNAYLSDCWGGLFEVAANAGAVDQQVELFDAIVEYNPALRTEMRVLSFIAQGKRAEAATLLQSVSFNDLLPSFMVPAKAYLLATGALPITAETEAILNNWSTPKAKLYRAWLAKKQGDSERFETLVAELQSSASAGNAWQFLLAELAVLQGNHDEAFRLLNAFTNKPVLYFWSFYRIEQSPFLASLTSDPRWEDWLTALERQRRALSINGPM